MSIGVLWVLLTLASAPSGQAAGTIPGAKLEPAELVADLPWAFEVAVEAPADAEDGSGPAAVKVPPDLRGGAA